MITFTIDAENRIARLDPADSENAAPDAGARFHSEEEFAELTQTWPAKQFVSTWNRLPEVTPVRQFASRKVALCRIWKKLQELPPASRKSRQPKTSRPARKPGAPVPSERDSKKDQVIALLSNGQGATLPQLMAATGWQKHSVRGFLSGTLKKKMNLKVTSAKNPAGDRVYRLSR